MKTTKLFLLGLAVILFSCNKEETPNPTVEGMVGTWAITAFDYNGTTTTTVQGTSVKSTFTGKAKDLDLTTTFTANPNTVTNEGSYSIEETTTILGQTTTEEYLNEETVMDGTWTLNGNKLTVTTVDGPQEATILEQTATTLKLKVEISETESDLGITFSTQVDGTYVFKKQ